MATWLIVLIAAAVVAIIGFLLYKHFHQVVAVPTVASQVVAADASRNIAGAVVAAMPRAPGIEPTSGQVPSNPPPPPAQGVLSQVRSLITPTGQLQHIPVVGSALATVARSPLTISAKINSTITNTLEHVPIAGKALAVPGKVAGKIISSIGSWF